MVMVIKRESDGYNVGHFEDDGSPAGDIVRLFGTNVLPSGFLAAADQWEVLDRITELNPDREVRLEVSA